jgi:chromosomal replication initiator protein
MSLEKAGAVAWKSDFDSRLAVVDAECARIPHICAGIDIPMAVRCFIAGRINNSEALIQAAVIRLALMATSGRAITIESAREELAPLFSRQSQTHTVESIKNAVADFYQMRVRDIDSDRRFKGLVRPRQVAMFFCKKLTRRSYPDIGRRFGGRDHTTVIHAVKRIEALIQSGDEIADDVAQIETLLRGVTADASNGVAI